MKDTDCHLLLLHKSFSIRWNKNEYVLFHKRTILRHPFHSRRDPRLWKIFVSNINFNFFEKIVKIILYYIVINIILNYYLENISKLCGWIVRFNASILWQGLMWTFVLWNPLWLDGDLRFQLPWTMVINYGGTVDYPN